MHVPHSYDSAISTSAVTPPALSRDEPSMRLREFVAASPLDREPILAFMRAAAASLPAGARVLDAGAGDAPYRELFAHCGYLTTDWSNSAHDGGRTADIVASLEALPVDDAQFDAVLNTQVLEHVEDPAAVVAELRRVLRPGGELWLTAPLVNELHEEPYDFYRFTPHALLSLLQRAGLEVVSIEPLTGSFTTFAMLARNAGLISGVGASGDHGRRALAAVFRGAARLLPHLDRFDRRNALPLGYRCRARRPAS